jgi:hypothetical protein
VKVLIGHHDAAIPDFGIPVLRGLPARYIGTVTLPDEGYVLVRDCWDGISVYAGPLTQAAVDAIPECGENPDVVEQKTQRTIVERLREVVPASDPDKLLDDIEGLKAYQQLASPTAAQTAAATKAQNRVLAAMVRRLLR